jgi:hypothetical protein
VNTLKLGLTAAQINIFDGNPEDIDNFSELIEELIRMDALEEQLVERIAICLGDAIPTNSTSDRQHHQTGMNSRRFIRSPRRLGRAAMAAGRDRVPSRSSG